MKIINKAVFSTRTWMEGRRHCGNIREVQREISYEDAVENKHWLASPFWIFLR